ncbi:FkbM family methyltransferase [Streptomyces sp. PSKA54]|uniref:FkbM family methyltransferase n=1 Tax=Streptomyces himalayensis subsp. aureolus TaxID=2758039 RepID=A0A7W2CXZ1_9ACTN|nr:FkbM family methyltransferase [Streptomyces himalayensis]MBA4860962.1 FkbM family methyltransferase [Streptomyces himalayensis subsp. aureolus]
MVVTSVAGAAENAMAHLTRRIKLKTAEMVVPRITRIRPCDDLDRLGSDYGGWWIPTDLLTDESVVYAAGVGEDVTFDLALIERFGCSVWAMDPTPRAIEYASRITEPRWHFLPFGLWKEDATVHFHPPADVMHVSHSATEARGSGPGFDAQCYSLRTFTEKLGHPRIDLLKMDIEGAEGPVLDQLPVLGILPRVICVEFDAPESPWTLRRRLRWLEEAGYVVRRTEARNYTLTLG